MKKNILHAVAFQLTWFACVQGSAIWAVVATAAWGSSHQRCDVTKNREWFLIGAFAATGFVLESVIQSLGLIGYAHAITVSETITLSPLWLLSLWVAFGTTLSHSFYWLYKKIKIVPLLCFTGRPSCEYAGSWCADSELSDPAFISLASVSIIWLVLLPVGLVVARNISQGSPMFSLRIQNQTA